MAERWIARLTRATHYKDAALPAGMVEALGVKNSDIPFILKSWRFAFRDGHALATESLWSAIAMILRERRAAQPGQGKAGRKRVRAVSRQGRSLPLRHWQKK